jgi:uncharacterized protein YjbI with pentapeptide repeats
MMTSQPTIARPPGFVVDIHGAFVRRADLSNAELERANLAGADATKADFRGANLKNANLRGTILRGADLRDVRNLTWDQLRDAVIDDTTKLPDYLRDIKPEPVDQARSERINEAARGDVD